jgi:hypothetical protein
MPEAGKSREFLSEAEARKVAEEARETEWQSASF